MAALPRYSTLLLCWRGDGILELALNRPGSLNAVNATMWQALRECLGALNNLDGLRLVLLTGGSCKHFCAGIDLKDATEHTPGVGVGRRDGSHSDDVARTTLRLRTRVKQIQATFDGFEALAVPVIACVHGACYGAGVDMIGACDVRWASEDAAFCIKEVDIGISADVGTLARLPKAGISASLLSELALSARRMGAHEALRCGLLSRLTSSREELMTQAGALALTIASKSPLAIVGTKHHLLYARDHSVAQALDYHALWNAALMQTDDVPQAMAQARKPRPGAVFAKL